MTDIVNEYYGPKAVRRISITAVILIAYAFLMYYLAIAIPASDVWLASSQRQGVDNIQQSFNAIFGQSNMIIVGSLVAFLVSQVVDVSVFHQIKKRTGNKHLWLRATGSTWSPSSVDSYIVLFIAFSRIFSWQQILAFGMMNYFYKFTVAIVLTPLIYLVERQIEKYVGHDTAKAMKLAAMGEQTTEHRRHAPGSASGTLTSIT
ncbi:queuosine precursor transporter [Puia sp. P3]|uniref:queuosine precursor transporter n=1 Tax=Puia sp. P3 TaxID=3423952 RepID=UPI003D6654EA